ncbi:TlpA family protein disulfide reductase [Gramella jeungdoensis]|uniref:TlpA family protein disulfide reductase n=1 Tax=Gramella jeungdoensis TaxID=708091 RepID=A0ABT0Z2U0_9FLAO|nr:TlpA disulfide reductase family protein [Gramella jeungdoensis]MCM8570034.1 TlpA family protein disulfide reductase [Gramella jeungdoensis]
MRKKKKSTKKAWVEYSIYAFIAIVLYGTGLHTEVIGFVHRGLLETGLLNPKVEERKEPMGTETLANSGDVKKYPVADLNLKLKDINGDSVSLSDLKGKVIFMNFWATWCPPCVAEMPGINKLHNALGDEVAFVMLSMDQEFEKAIDYKERKEFGLPIYEPVSQIPSMYGSSQLPTTYVIDAEGYLVLTHMGMADYNTEEFKTFLKSLK